MVTRTASTPGMSGKLFIASQQADGPPTAGGAALLRRDSLRQSLQRSSQGRGSDAKGGIAAASHLSSEQEVLPEHGRAPTALDGSLHATVMAHSHTRYCDRTLRVCTAEGRLREGNGIVLDASRVPALAAPRAMHSVAELAAAGWTVSWFASVVDDSAEAEGEEIEAEGERFVPIEQPHPPTAPLSPPTAVSAVSAAPVPPDWLSFLSACGVPLDMPCLTPAAILAARAALDAGGSAAADVMPTFSSAGACAGGLGLFIECARDPWRLALSTELVGRSLLCRVSRGAEAWVSPAWGPVEPAPPRCREVWVEGEAVVGGVLTANAWYWGGRPGSCLFHWVRVSAEGERTTYEPRSADLSTLPDTASTAAAGADGSGTPADGRVMPVTAADVGCKFKVTAEPARIDGMVAERTSSRPSKAVMALK